MITKDGKRLEVFDNFIVDSKLKAKDLNPNNYSLEVNGISLVGNGNWMDVPMNSDGTFTQEAMLVDYLAYVYSQNPTIINWLKLKIARTFSSNKKTKKAVKVNYKSVDDFFKSIKSVVKKNKIKESSLNFYKEALKNAEENGQIALKEILASKSTGLLRELNMLNEGVVDYVSEEDVITFYKKYKLPEKTLKLTWIKNYIRVIPSDVIEKKKEMDKKYIFDNYVVLHFDKNDNGSQMTAKEIEKAKDPILFGVIKESNKLFYVGDWIDEYCDLTLDKFLKEMELETAREISQDTIEKEILK